MRARFDRSVGCASEANPKSWRCEPILPFNLGVHHCKPVKTWLDNRSNQAAYASLSL